ncbi:zinc finger, CCHC-type containing protein [Tanacetum coccineum]
MAGNTVKDMTTNFGKLDKFEGHDFRRWQKKMHFLLTTLKVVYVLTTPMRNCWKCQQLVAIRIRANIVVLEIDELNMQETHIECQLAYRESLRAQDSRWDKGKGLKKLLDLLINMTCGKTGHFKRDCRSGDKKNANAGGSGKGSKDRSQDQGIIHETTGFLIHHNKMVDVDERKNNALRNMLDHNYYYCYSIVEDPEPFNDAMQSRILAFCSKEAIDDEIWFYYGKLLMGEQHWHAITRGIQVLNKGTMIMVYHIWEYPALLEGYSDVVNKSVDRFIFTSGWMFLLGGFGMPFNGFQEAKHASLVLYGNLEFVALAPAAVLPQWLRLIVRAIEWNVRPLGVRLVMIRELIMNGVISIEFVRSQKNLADHLTKGLARDLVNNIFVIMAGNTVKDMTTNFGKLDKFEGHDFRRWQKKMHFLLTTLKVVYVLTTPMSELLEDATVKAIRIRAKWENDDYICKGHILNGMSDSLFDVYMNVESAKELWDSLESKYMAEDSSSKKFLVSNFNNYKMVDSRPVMEQYNELLRILGQYTQHGLKMDESISVSSIIDKLPPSWKDFKHTLKHGKDDLSLVQLGSHLRIEESLRAQDSDKGKGKEVAGPSVNMTEEGKNKNNKQNKGKKRDFKEHGSGSGSNKKPKLECWKCGKTGHFKRDCRSGNKKNANAGGSGKGSKDHSQDQGLMQLPW